MSVRDAVAAELEGMTGWQVETALALADEVDRKGTAASAKELRALMADLGASVPQGEQKETPVSDFTRRLREREAQAARRAASG